MPKPVVRLTIKHVSKIKEGKEERIVEHAKYHVDLAPGEYHLSNIKDEGGKLVLRNSAGERVSVMDDEGNPFEHILSGADNTISPKHLIINVSETGDIHIKNAVGKTFIETEGPTRAMFGPIMELKGSVIMRHGEKRSFILGNLKKIHLTFLVEKIVSKL